MTDAETGFGAQDTTPDTGAGMPEKTPRKRGQTRETILAATKELVARKGPHATTIRDITLASGANVAAVNYHFQSKENLVTLAALEIGAEVNKVRDALLTAAEVAAGGAAVAPRVILQALLAPVVTHSRAEDGGSLYVRNIYQMRTVPYAEDNRRHFGSNYRVAQHFVEAIRKTFPHLTQEQAIWRYELARGSALHMFANVDPLWRRFELLEAGIAEALPPSPAHVLDDAMVARVIEMILPAFTAPEVPAP